MVDYKAMQNSSDEKSTIAEHHQDKVDALRGRFAVEMLSFLGIAIGFSLSFFNVLRTRRQIRTQIKNLD